MEDLNEAKLKKNDLTNENLANFEMELQEIKDNLADFGPEGFYAVPYESFKREFPIFTEKVIESFLDEMDDPGKGDWQKGELIWENDWPCLIEGAEKLLNGKGFQWEKLYTKYYKPDNGPVEVNDVDDYDDDYDDEDVYEESLTEGHDKYEKYIKKVITDVYGRKFYNAMVNARDYDDVWEAVELIDDEDIQDDIGNVVDWCQHKGQVPYYDVLGEIVNEFELDDDYNESLKEALTEKEVIVNELTKELKKRGYDSSPLKEYEIKLGNKSEIDNQNKIIYCNGANNIGEIISFISKSLNLKPDREAIEYNNRLNRGMQKKIKDKQSHDRVVRDSEATQELIKNKKKPEQDDDTYKAFTSKKSGGLIMGKKKR